MRCDVLTLEVPMAEATRRQCVLCAARAARLLRPRRVRADGAASLRTPISALCVTVSVHHEIAAARPRAAGLFWSCGQSCAVRRPQQ